MSITQQILFYCNSLKKPIQVPTFIKMQKLVFSGVKRKPGLSIPDPRPPTSWKNIWHVFPSLSREIECLIDCGAERLSRVVNMSKKSYKLTYFKARGRGEFIRLVFLIAGVEFEDHQVDFHEEWPSLKASKYLSRVSMACSVGVSPTRTFEVWGFDLQRSSKTEKLSFAIHTCCAYRQLRPCGRRRGGRELGRDGRALCDETTKDCVRRRSYG